MTKHLPAPLDIASTQVLANKNKGLQTKCFFSETPLDKSHNTPLINILEKHAFFSSAPSDEQLALSMKLGEIINFITYTTRIAYNIKNIEDHKHRPKYEAKACPLLDWLNSPIKQETPPNNVLNQHFQLQLKSKQSVYMHLRSLKRKVLSLRKYYSKIDTHIIQPNDLVKAFLAKRELKAQYAHEEFFSLKAVQVSDALEYNCTFTEKLSQQLEEFIKKELTLSSSRFPNLFPAIKTYINFQCYEAVEHIKQLRSSSAYKHLPSTFISGSPKYIGVLLSWYYRLHNRKVIRFAHGGERGLFDDRGWPLRELLYCDQYFFHGKGEAQLVENRMKAHYASTPLLSLLPNRYDSIPSKNHWNIFKSSKVERSNAHNDKELVYMAGSYLEELSLASPAFKMPDNIMLEWQYWLLKTLNNMGYKVIFKPHPKGLQLEKNFIKKYCDTVIYDKLEIREYSAKTFLFDFAGSAFMDLVASHKNVVLFDFANRPFDENGKELLQKRVNIYPTYFDELGRARVKEGYLKALQGNKSKNSEAAVKCFMDDYFA